MGIRQSFNRLGNNAVDWVLDRVICSTANYVPYEAISPRTKKPSEQKNTPV